MQGMIVRMISCTWPINTLQKTNGLFCGHLVLRVLATHLSITEQAANVPGLHTPAIANPRPFGGIGLAAASVKLIIWSF